MKPKYSLHERIAVRAYYIAAQMPRWSDMDCWSTAEAIEFELLNDRCVAARKGAATKRNRLARDIREHIYWLATP